MRLLAFEILFINPPTQKTPPIWVEYILCWHRSTFPGRHQPSIIDADELNCRVRNGNGCDLIAICTNS